VDLTACTDKTLDSIYSEVIREKSARSKKSGSLEKTYWVKGDRDAKTYMHIVNGMAKGFDDSGDFIDFFSGAKAFTPREGWSKITYQAYHSAYVRRLEKARQWLGEDQ